VYLDLTNKGISTIDSNLFNEHFSNAEYIELDSNYIQKLDSRTFRGLTSLKWLAINYNPVNYERNVRNYYMVSYATKDQSFDFLYIALLFSIK
jgi:hypothetical protein